MKQRRVWTKQQDQVLRYLRQIKAQKKWSIIAKKMQQEYSILGRSGKQCRQRYYNHLDSTIKNTQWTPQEDKLLYQQHDQVGNRWAVISNKLSGRTDSCVKNRFYSKLRKSIRRINKFISQNFKKQYKQIKTSLLYKIIETSQSKFKITTVVDQQIAEFCIDIKNKLFFFQENFHENQQQHMKSLRLLIEDIHNFGKNNKNLKVIQKKYSMQTKDFLHPMMYLKNFKSISDFSQSDLSSSHFSSSSKIIESQQQQQNQQSQSQKQQKQIDLSATFKSLNDLSKKGSNHSRTNYSSTNLRLTRSRSKDYNFSFLNKSSQYMSDNQSQKNQRQDSINTFTGENFLAHKSRLTTPFFYNNGLERSRNSLLDNQQDIQSMLMAQKIIEQKSSGSNKHSKHSQSQSNSLKSQVNMFFQDSNFQMRILSPKNIQNNSKMSSQQQLFDKSFMEMQQQMERQYVDSIRTFSLGKEILNNKEKQHPYEARFDNLNFFHPYYYNSQNTPQTPKFYIQSQINPFSEDVNEMFNYNINNMTEQTHKNINHYNYNNIITMKDQQQQQQHNLNNLNNLNNNNNNEKTNNNDGYYQCIEELDRCFFGLERKGNDNYQKQDD